MLTNPAHKYLYAAADEPPPVFLGLDNLNRQIGVPLERMAITVAGARTGKGACLLIPNARRWPENLLVVDPKGENAAASWQARRALGQRVVVLDPFRVADVPDDLRGSFNPMASISPDSFTGREDLEVIADGLVKRSDPKHEEWYDGAASILAGILAFIVESAPPEDRTLSSLREVLQQPRENLLTVAKGMQQSTTFGGLARDAGLTIQTALEADKGMEKDFLAAARRATRWLDSEPIKETLAASSLSLSDLKRRELSLYVVLPPKYIETHAAFLRLIVRTAINAMMDDGATINRRCLFLLDEFYTLGRLDIISKSAGLMAGYGLHLWPFLQDIMQLKALYAEVSDTFFANSDVSIFFGNDDPPTLDNVSRRIGITAAQDLNISPPVAPLMPERGDLARALSADHQNAMSDFQTRARHVGSARVPPTRVAALTGKAPSEEVAHGMFAFIKGGDVLLLRLSPYFKPYICPYVPKIVEEVRLPEKENHVLAVRQKDAEKIRKQTLASQRIAVRNGAIIGLGASLIFLNHGPFFLPQIMASAAGGWLFFMLHRMGIPLWDVW